MIMMFLELVVEHPGVLDRTSADEKTIAAYMLMASWQDEANHQYLDKYHWINNTGCLNVEDIQTIARDVWG